MPFAGYSDFADCVRKNSDKADPEAYCATIQREVEKGMSKSKRFRLRNLDITRIDHVDQGANQHASIAFAKNAQMGYGRKMPMAKEQDEKKKPFPPQAAPPAGAGGPQQPGFVPRSREALAGQVRDRLAPQARPGAPAPQPPAGQPMAPKPPMPGQAPAPMGQPMGQPPMAGKPPVPGMPGQAGAPMAPGMPGAAPAPLAPTGPLPPPGAAPGVPPPGFEPRPRADVLREQLELQRQKKKLGATVFQPTLVDEGAQPGQNPFAKRDALRRRLLAKRYVEKGRKSL